MDGYGQKRESMLEWRLALRRSAKGRIIAACVYFSRIS